MATKMRSGSSSPKGLKYLVSIDGTELGKKAFATALEYAGQNDHVYLLSVAVSNYVTKADDRVKNDCKLQLSKYGNILTEKQIPHTLLLGKGTPRELIVEEAKAKDVDMIFMGRTISSHSNSNHHRTLSSMLKAPDTTLYVASYAHCCVRLCNVPSPTPGLRDLKKKIKGSKKHSTNGVSGGSPPTSPRNLDTGLAHSEPPQKSKVTHSANQGLTRDKTSSGKTKQQSLPAHLTSSVPPGGLPTYNAGGKKKEKKSPDLISHPPQHPTLSVSPVKVSTAKRRTHKRVFSDSSGADYSSRESESRAERVFPSPMDLTFAAEELAPNQLSSPLRPKFPKKKKNSKVAKALKVKKTHKRTASAGSDMPGSLYRPEAIIRQELSGDEKVKKRKKRSGTVDKEAEAELPRGKTHKRVHSDSESDRRSFEYENHDLLFPIQSSPLGGPKIRSGSSGTAPGDGMEAKKQQKHKSKIKEKRKHKDKMKQKELAPPDAQEVIKTNTTNNYNYNSATPTITNGIDTREPPAVANPERKLKKTMGK